jgi:hypothetical protein
MKLEHPNALKLKAVADKYLAWSKESFPGDAKMLACGEYDYENFMSIALMIESDEFDTIAIRRAIRNLDTFVRDYIPDNIYDLYCG